MRQLLDAYQRNIPKAFCLQLDKICLFLHSNVWHSFTSSFSIFVLKSQQRRGKRFCRTKVVGNEVVDEIHTSALFYVNRMTKITIYRALYEPQVIKYNVPQENDNKMHTLKNCENQKTREDVVLSFIRSSPAHCSQHAGGLLLVSNCKTSWSRWKNCNCTLPLSPERPKEQRHLMILTSILKINRLQWMKSADESNFMPSLNSQTTRCILMKSCMVSDFQSCMSFINTSFLSPRL